MSYLIAFLIGAAIILIISQFAKEIFKETGSNEESFNFVTDEIIDLLKTPFNGTTFMRKLVDLRSNYEEEE